MSIYDARISHNLHVDEIQGRLQQGSSSHIRHFKSRERLFGAAELLPEWLNGRCDSFQMAVCNARGHEHSWGSCFEAWKLSWVCVITSWKYERIRTVIQWLRFPSKSTHAKMEGASACEWRDDTYGYCRGTFDVSKACSRKAVYARFGICRPFVAAPSSASQTVHSAKKRHKIRIRIQERASKWRVWTSRAYSLFYMMGGGIYGEAGKFISVRSSRSSAILLLDIFLKFFFWNYVNFCSLVVEAHVQLLVEMDLLVLQVLQLQEERPMNGCSRLIPTIVCAES
jgi:hypothetical protein